MSNNIRILSIVFSCALLFAGRAHAFWMWTPETNKWINPKYAVKETPKEQLEYALGLLESEDYPRAINECLKLIKHYPKSREAAEAQYYIGRAYERQGELFRAFQAYQKVIEKYPFSERSGEIVERQYAIGERMLEGEGQRNAFISAIMGGEYPVVEVFRTVIKNAPYGAYAAPSQYKIGLFLQEQRMYQEAREEFDKVINDYPDSEWVKAARYQTALADAMRSSDAPYDQRTTKAAVEEFRDFVRNYPDAELTEKARGQIGELRSKEGENNFLIGRFYEKNREYEAARMYYRNVMEEYADTPAAAKARERLRALDETL